MALTGPCATWLVGMPEYRLSFAERRVPSVPLGGADDARAVLHACEDEGAFHRRIEEEYLSVLAALLEAGMPFRILNLREAATPLAERLRREGYPDFYIGVPPQGSTYTYPRDLMVYLSEHNIALVHENWLQPGVERWNSTACWRTRWAEGGRVLMSGDTLVVLRHPEKERASDQATLNRLRERGLRVVEIPAGNFYALDGDGHVDGIIHDRHIDRSAGLVRAPDGSLHLVLDPGYRTGPLDSPMDAAASLDAVRRACDASGISLHVFPDTGIPYATSLIQSSEGVVVSGCAEPAARALLESIAGAGNVVTTATSMTHFPVFASAGLHCIVTESPEFLLASSGDGAPNESVG